MWEFYWGTSKSQHFEWGICGFLVIFNGVIFSYKYSSGVSDFSNGVKKWAIFGNIFHWGDEWGGSHWVTEAGVFIRINDWQTGNEGLFWHLFRRSVFFMLWDDIFQYAGSWEEFNKDGQRWSLMRWNRISIQWYSMYNVWCSFTNSTILSQKWPPIN